MNGNPLGGFANLEAIIFVFLLVAVVLFAVPKCGKDKIEDEPIETEQTTEMPILPPPTTTADATVTTTVAEPVVEETVVEEPAPKPAVRITERPKPAAKKTQMTVKKPKVVEEQLVEEVRVEEVEAISIFTVVDSVNIRSKPGRNGAILERVISHGTEMYYVGEKTKNMQKIRIGEVDYNEPWLKVRTPQGRTGWVYGGTVRFYKR